MADFWFKRRRFGFGWTPVTWQGWLIIVIYLLIVLGCSLLYSPQFGLTEEGASTICIFVVVPATLVLVFVSYLKGPKPRWRWGRSSKDVPTEDF